MICANKNNPLFQELSKNVPSGFITKLLTENPEIKPEEIYSRYIAKLQQLDKGQVELPNVIPLKGNEQLYKDYNLLAKDGKVKVIKEKEASSWLEKLHRSPYYSFAYRKTGLKEGRIFILPKQEPVEEAKPGKPEQLTLFAESKGKGNKFSNYIPGKNSDSQTVLKQIAQTGGALAAIAKQLLKSGLNIPIEILDVDNFNKDNMPEGEVFNFDKTLGDNFQAGAFWSPTQRKIFLARGANVQNTAGILMHEILHGYTNLYMVNNPNSVSVKNLDRLLKHLQTDKVQQMLTDKYPLTNLDELLVGIFTNPTFINDLKKLPPTNKNFKSVWEEILQIFRVIFGVTNTSLFDEVFAASSVIVDESMEQMIEQEGYIDSSYIKPGVQELFDSNPELANAVYEALGFFKSSTDRISDYTHKNGIKEFAINGDHYFIRDGIYEINGESVSEFIFMEGFNKYLDTLISKDKKQQAQQLYSQYLEQNPNGSIEQFKSWVDEFNRNKSNLEQQSENKTTDEIYKEKPYLKEFIDSVTDEPSNISIYKVKNILDKHGEGRIVKLNKILYNAINRLWDNNVFAQNNIKIKFVDSLPENAVGNFNRDNNEITIDKRKFLNNVISEDKNYPIFYLGYILNHEIIHYLTPKDLSLKIEYIDRALNGKFGDTFKFEHEREFGKNIKELYDIASTTLENISDYGFLNLAEFVAEAMSNPSFQEKLASISFKTSKQSLWKRFIEILSAYLSLNTKKPITNTLLEAVIAETTNYITENSNIQKTYKRRKSGKTENIDIGYDFVYTTQKNINSLSDFISQKSQENNSFQQFQQSLNKPNTNPILQGNQQEQVKKFAELQERLNNKEFIEGAKSAYESTPALQEFGTQEEYNDYIARVSLGILKNPSSGEYNYNSKVKVIVYHGTNAKFDKFDKSKLGTKTINKTNQLGFYFSNKKVAAIFNSLLPKNYYKIPEEVLIKLYNEYSELYGKDKAKEILDELVTRSYDKSKMFDRIYLPDSNFIAAVINCKNPLTANTDEFARGTRGDGTEIADIYKSKVKNNDSIILPALEDGGLGGEEFESDNYVVFEPEQIHILGSKQDIEGFKEFVSKRNKVLAAPASNVQKIVSDRLDNLQTKVIRNPQDNSVVIKDLENIQWIRPSEVAKSKIQKRQFGLKTVEQEEFEKLAQEAGTILHNIQANIIKETFPEYNKHVQKMVIDEGMLGFEQAIRKQLQPIINEAKSRGSILKAEVWIGNLKSQKGGTADLLEITPEGNYYVYDLKTRFTQDVSPLRRFNKINEWSDQTLEYNEILKAGDSELGVVQGKVLGTYILELEVEVKPENKFNYSGSTKYKATNAEKFLKRRELKNIKIVAPTFFLTGDRKIDAMINKLRSQIENMAKKTVSQEQRPAFNQTFESKLDLLQALQLKKDYNKFIQSGYIELAIIRKKLESNDLTDSAFIKEQLELYTNALGLLNPPQEVREQFKKIQGEAQELEIMFEELRKETVVDSANQTDVIKRVGFADNLFAAVKDVNWVFSQTMGLADVDNPIVQTVFRKTTVALEKAREKVQQLGNRLMEVSNAYIKATGDKTYSKLIENGHLVDQWKPDFWKEFNAAKNQKNFDWAKDNVTFDEKSYIEARDKQLDFHDSITRDVYANKLKLENPDLDQNEIKRLVEAEIAAQMKKWEAGHKNAFTYFTPKTKWTNPKYTDIINGPEEVKEMYLTLKNLLEYANEIIPERVKKNFIPNFQRDYIDKATQLGLLGSIKASWSGFFDGVEVTYDDEMMSQKDAITGEKLGRMWIPGITEIENKSLDLPVVFFKFMEGVYRYEELKSLEDLALTAKDILKKQQWLATDMLGNAISVDKTPSRPNPASRTLAMMEGWVDQVFYNKSLQKDVAVEIKGNGFTELIGILKKGDKKMLSIGKMVDKVIHWTTLKNLGFSLYSPMVNLLGGSANMYMTGANGLYYSKSDLNKAMGLALAGKTNLPNEDTKKARLILDWLNINAGEFIKKQEDLLSNSTTKKLMADYNALALMRESENVLRNAGALAVVLGGKYEFNWDSFKVVDGKLVVEANDFQKSKFKQQIIKINRKNIGGISEDDMMLAKQQIVGRMLMQHRSWLPALFYERFGGKKYDWVLDKDIEGRYVTAFRLFKHLVGLSKITQLSEMEQANLKSARIELALIIGIGILRSLLKSGLDDEDKKEAWYKISDKISDRVTGELVFFIDPTFESQINILLSPAPVLGTAQDVGKFIGSLYKADDEDKRTKGPLQRAVKLTPLSKVDAFLTDLGMNPIDEK